LLAPRPHPGGIDAGIDDQVCDVDVFRSQFAGHGLRHRAQSELGAGKCRVAGAAAQGCGGAGEENVALPSFQHQASRFAACQEARPARHLPDFPEHAVGGLEDRKVDIGPDVEDADFQRRVLVGVVEKGGDLLLLARVERPRHDRSARRLDVLHQWLELRAVTPAGEHGESLGCEFLGDFGADKITGADHGASRVALLHGLAPNRSIRERGFQSRDDGISRSK